MSVQIQTDTEAMATKPMPSHVMVVLGRRITAEDVQRIGQTLAAEGANIDTIRGIADYPVTGLGSFTVANPRPGGGVELRKAVSELTAELHRHRSRTCWSPAAASA